MYGASLDSLSLNPPARYHDCFLPGPAASKLSRALATARMRQVAATASSRRRAPMTSSAGWVG